MNKQYIIISIIISLILVVSSCTDLKKDLPVATSGGVKIHDASWNDPASTNFHGKILKIKEYNLNTCITCHAKSFNGGISGVSCSQCHQSYPHKFGWKDSTSASFHGKFLLLGQGQLSHCAACHGADYGGGTSGKTCYKCHTTYPHLNAWDNVDSTGFHGKILKANGYQLEGCKPCHGDQLTGGSSGISCYNCHGIYPHLAAWGDVYSSGFHGKVLKANGYQVEGCKACHGDQFTGGSSGISCYTCHTSYPHKIGWMDAASDNYHGKYLKSKDWQVGECALCHGVNFDGGTSGVSCRSCHTAFPHPNDFDETDGHPVYMRTNSFPLDQCKLCHGDSYGGGSIVDVSCNDCHTTANGPEACNTCHGVFLAAANDTITWAPPPAVNGIENSPSVGAHQAHLAEGGISSLIKCNQCHNVPAFVTAAGHIDTSLPADVKFDTSLAGLKSADHTFNPNPSFSYSSLKCNNTFCHGNWKVRQETAIDPDIFTDTIMTGAAYAPTWTAGASEITCGKCHGLPPNGHSSEDISECGDCHSGIVDPSGVIVKKEKHINGKINVYGMELHF